MDNDNERKEPGVIDLKHIFLTLWHRAWIILLCAVVAGALGFAYAVNFITPLYSSTVMMFVNTSVTVGSINVGQLSLGAELIDTYIVILNNRTTLTRVIEETGLSYSYGQLSNMIAAAPVSDTAIFSVTVTAPNPYDAQKLASAISVVLPERVSEVIEGSSVKVVDEPVASNAKVSPNVTLYTARGLLIGAVLAIVVIVLIDIFDNVIRDESDLREAYDIPILAKIPDLLSDRDDRYGSYYDSSRSYRSPPPGSDAPHEPISGNLTPKKRPTPPPRDSQSKT